jgi:hypothetical protein
LFETTGIKHQCENTVLLRNGLVTRSMKQCVVVKSTSYWLYFTDEPWFYFSACLDTQNEIFSSVDYPRTVHELLTVKLGYSAPSVQQGC